MIADPPHRKCGLQQLRRRLPPELKAEATASEAGTFPELKAEGTASEAGAFPELKAEATAILKPAPSA